MFGPEGIKGEKGLPGPRGPPAYIPDYILNMVKLIFIICC